MVLKQFIGVLLVWAGTNLLASDASFNQEDFDPECQPCADFYQYVNGGWLARTEIPDAYSRWSVFNELHERNEKNLLALAERAAGADSPDSVQALVGTFFAAAMDEKAIEAHGLKPLDADLARIAGIETREDVAQVIGELHAQGAGLVFNFFSQQDAKDSSQVIAAASQGGLGLPDRDYYLSDDEDATSLRADYQVFVGKMFELLGEEAELARTHAQQVVELETRLAKASLSRVERRDPNKRYNLITVAQAEELTPHFSWRQFLGELQVDLTSLSVAPESFFSEFDRAIADAPVAQWQSYLRFHLLDESAPLLNQAAVDLHFSFHGKRLTGSQEIRPRWKRALRMTDQAIGEALGQLYVAKHFPPQAKTRVLEMIENLRVALGQRLQDLEWMSAETKQKALAKLATFNPKIGYPDQWRDYSGLSFSRTDYFANVRAASRFELRRTLSKIGKPLDRGEWFMSPQTVNAYYSPALNEIVFPAGILQPPFFDFSADDAVNYGAMGAVIGHEMMHGFDDSGSQYDAEGNLANWWTSEDRSQFEERAEKLVQQFDGFVAIGDLHVNGKLTLGENIGDLGGLIVAFAGLQRALEKRPQDVIDGFTPQQRFYLSWARAWRSLFRDEALRLQVKTNTHAPGRFRANGPLANLTDFHQAFGCKQGDQMFSEGAARVEIW